jgi:hypothetical protein
MDKEKTVRMYSRREMLTRAGIAAGGMLAAPMFVSTAAASPSAGTGKRCVQLALQGSSAGGIGPCDYGDSPGRPCPCHQGGFVGPACDQAGAGNCLCFMNTKGCATCVDVASVGCFSPACKKPGDCPAGWSCVYSCCDACPNGVGCCDDCTGGSNPSQGPSGKGLTCLPPCTSAGVGKMSAAARANAYRLARASRR